MVESKGLDVVGSGRDNQAQERFGKGCEYISSGGNDKCAVGDFVSVIDKPAVREVSRQTTANGLLRFMV